MKPDEVLAGVDGVAGEEEAHQVFLQVRRPLVAVLALPRERLEDDLLEPGGDVRVELRAGGGTSRVAHLLQRGEVATRRRTASRR